MIEYAGQDLIDASIYRDPTKIEGGSSGHIDQIWSPEKNIETGIGVYETRTHQWRFKFWNRKSSPNDG